VVDSCTPGTPAANDDTCNGVDDDCDGNIDENYPSASTSCGQGACARTGTRSCVGGTVVDSCTPGTPAANDDTCNGVDDDCNGQVDEDYVPKTCGVGYCLDTNAPSRCVGGVDQACSPGTKLSDDDASADGVDDDCDGQVDEDACFQRTEAFNYNTSAHTLDL